MARKIGKLTTAKNSWFNFKCKILIFTQSQRQNVFDFLNIII